MRNVMGMMPIMKDRLAKAPVKTLGIGKVPDMAPVTGKAKAVLSGIPMAVRGRKPRLGGL